VDKFHLQQLDELAQDDEPDEDNYVKAQSYCSGGLGVF
jgi:hypothetical protein